MLPTFKQFLLTEIWDSKIFRQQIGNVADPYAKDSGYWDSIRKSKVAPVVKKPLHIVPATDHDPYNGQWTAIDTNRYDGAEDAGPQYIGYGNTEKEAIEDLVQQIEDDNQ